MFKNYLWHRFYCFCERMRGELSEPVSFAEFKRLDNRTM